MHTTTRPDHHAALIGALAAPTASPRLQAALFAGTHPHDALVRPLVDRCAVEPDFFVRDMLTWALTRHPAAVTVPLLLDELGSSRPQARSQALHALSKVGNRAAWARVPTALLHDEDDEVARSAWRAGVALAPAEDRARLAEELARELGRGGQETRRSLSRALVALGDAALPVLTAARSARDEAARAHAMATEALLADPDSDFAASLEEAERAVLLAAAPATGDQPC